MIEQLKKLYDQLKDCSGCKARAAWVKQKIKALEAKLTENTNA